MSGSWVWRAVGWSLTWGIGAAIGVALGAYVTVLGAAAAPGDVALDSTELLVLPAAAGATVFLISFLLRVVTMLAHALMSRDGNGGGSDEHGHEGQDVG